MKKRLKGYLGAVTVAAIVGSLPAAAFADYEGSLHTVEQYGAAPLCCTNCSDLAYPNNDGVAVKAELLDMSYDQVAHWTNAAVDGRDWAEGTDEADPEGTDFADVIFYSGHGGRDCTGDFSSIVMGDNNTGESCSPQTNNMWFDGDANVAIFASCQSVHYCAWTGGAYIDMAPSSSQLNLIAGFHGLSYDSLVNTDAYGDYVYWAENNGIGDDWLDELNDESTWVYDQCATVVVLGSSSAARDEMFNWGGFKDFTSTGSHAGSTYYYMCGCSPDEGETIPC